MTQQQLMMRCLQSNSCYSVKYVYASDGKLLVMSLLSHDHAMTCPYCLDWVLYNMLTEGGDEFALKSKLLKHCIPHIPM